LAVKFGVISEGRLGGQSFNALDMNAFSIGFDHRDRERLHALWDEAIEAERWSDGPLTRRFEEAWAAWNGLPAVATSSWTGAALAAFEYFGVRGRTVLCPSNTFMATPLAIQAGGGLVQFVDCNREDLCMSFDDFERKAWKHRPHAAVLVHIGGHIGADVETIAAFCRAEGIVLLEDCAHAHGAAWHGRRAGTWGEAGIWSFAATKTISTGEGGMLVSRNADLLDFARSFLEYGKPDHSRPGLNYRMNEFTAALGIVGVERLDEIVAWKNAFAREHLDPLYPNRVELPEGMVSGLYKYIVFQPLERSTGKVYDEPCHRIMQHRVELANSDWIAQNHWCAPLYYRPAATPALVTTSR
jgi:dTDP-4-amino-4,6-dideoxygalactose transaminase